jgi:hypothetical protein
MIAGIRDWESDAACDIVDGPAAYDSEGHLPKPNQATKGPSCSWIEGGLAGHVDHWRQRAVEVYKDE